MQLVDRYAGGILCFVLQMARMAGSLMGRSMNKGPVKRIALLKFWGMGTIIVASPSILQLRKKYPDAKITFVTFQNNVDIVSMLSVADRIISINIRKGFLRFAVDTLRALIQLRRERPDLLFDLEFFTRFSAIVSYLSGARERIGFHSWEIRRGDLHTTNVSFNRYWHMGDNYRNLLGVEAGNDMPSITISDVAVRKVNDLLRERGIPGGGYFCVNVNAAVEFGWERRWEGRRFAELADRIIGRSGLHAVFIGAWAEKEYVDSVIAQARCADKTHNLSGCTDSAQLAALLQGGKMLISNDTGPLHLAAALGTPTVSFFGSDTPVLYGPRGASHLVFYRNIDCSPCVSVMVSKEIQCHKGFPQCLTEITVDDVFSEMVTKGVFAGK